MRGMKGSTHVRTGTASPPMRVMQVSMPSPGRRTRIRCAETCGRVVFRPVLSPIRTPSRASWFLSSAVPLSASLRADSLVVAAAHGGSRPCARGRVRDRSRRKAGCLHAGRRSGRRDGCLPGPGGYSLIPDSAAPAGLPRRAGRSTACCRRRVRLNRFGAARRHLPRPSPPYRSSGGSSAAVPRTGRCGPQQSPR